MASIAETSPPSGNAELVVPLDGFVARLDEPNLLETLISYRKEMPPTMSIEQALPVIHQANIMFAAVVDQGRILGLVSRNQLDKLLANRFGFALYGHQPEQPKAYRTGTRDHFKRRDRFTSVALQT